MEHCELYTASRKATGKSIGRTEKIPKGMYVLVVGIWTINSRGQLLLTYRHPQKPAWPSCWENSGGAVQEGETTLRAARRELREETGIDAPENEFVLLGTVKEGSAFVDCFLVYKDIELSELVLQEGETVDARWATPEELEELIQKGLVAGPVAQRWLQMKGQIIKEIEKRRTR